MKYYDNSLATVDKPTLFRLGLLITQDFCRANNIPYPRVSKATLNSRGKWTALRTEREFGQVWVDLSACRTAVLSNEGRSWTYPGYKADVTPLGVLAHEVGHHVGFYKRIFNIPGARNLVSGYEPNGHEVVAESLRLFILNPQLLQIIAPKRYDYLIASGLKPVVTETWQEVLAGAPARIFATIGKRIKQA